MKDVSFKQEIGSNERNIRNSSQSAKIPNSTKLPSVSASIGQVSDT